jgi:hypothetical protein
VNVGAIDANGTATVTFVLTVDGAQLDNRYVPMEIGLTAGDSDETEETQLLVGYASTATVDWTSDADGWLQIDLGVGDTEAPGWTTTMYAATTVIGAVTTSLDITDQGDLLPPGSFGQALMSLSTYVGLEASATERANDMRSVVNAHHGADRLRRGAAGGNDGAQGHRTTRGRFAGNFAQYLLDHRELRVSSRGTAHCSLVKNSGRGDVGASKTPSTTGQSGSNLREWCGSPRHRA